MAIGNRGGGGCGQDGLIAAQQAEKNLKSGDLQTLADYLWARDL